MRLQVACIALLASLLSVQVANASVVGKWRVSGKFTIGCPYHSGGGSFKQVFIFYKSHRFQIGTAANGRWFQDGTCYKGVFGSADAKRNVQWFLNAAGLSGLKVVSVRHLVFENRQTSRTTLTGLVRKASIVVEYRGIRFNGYLKTTYKGTKITS